MRLIKRLAEDTFYLSLLTWLIYFILELVKEGLISNYFDLNLLLIWVMLFGALNAGLNIKPNSGETGNKEIEK